MDLGFHGAKGGLLTGGIFVPLPFRHVNRLSVVKGGFFAERSGYVCFR